MHTKSRSQEAELPFDSVPCACARGVEVLAAVLGEFNRPSQDGVVEQIYGTHPGVSADVFHPSAFLRVVFSARYSLDLLGAPSGQVGAL